MLIRVEIKKKLSDFFFQTIKSIKNQVVLSRKELKRTLEKNITKKVQ